MNNVTNTDYFPFLLAITDENNEIEMGRATGEKPVDEFLARKFKLSRPTVRELLSRWEKEVRIEITKSPLLGKISKVRVLLNLNKNNGILVLVDFENLFLNLAIPPQKRLSIVTQLERVLRQIAQEIGKIVDIQVFAPAHAASVWGESFYERLNIPIQSCPKVKTKTGEYKDTVDEMLIERGKKMISEMPGLTHLCIGSGDKDFGLLVQAAALNGLEIMIIAGDLQSLSHELIESASEKPNGSKMIYILPSTQE